MRLFWLFLIVPIVEIALFIQVGGAIGLWPTLALVLAAGMMGLALMRAQGLRAMSQIQQDLNRMRDPTRPAAHGLMILIAGLLLVLPGFFTDAVGLLLLVPAVRSWVMRRIAARMRMVHLRPADRLRRDPHRPPYQDGVIDGDYEVADPSAGRLPPDLPPETGDAPMDATGGTTGRGRGGGRGGARPGADGSGWTRH